MVSARQYANYAYDFFLFVSGPQDRWGQSLLDLIGTLDELTHLGVGFVSLTEALDMTTPSGRALAGTLPVFAAFERDILRDQVRAGTMLCVI